MSALIWKELRENARWALLAMLALGGAELYALYHTQYPGQIDYYFNDGITLCRKPFLTVTTFGCAAVGLVLGLLQILPELKRDRWAALLHRPLSRGRFFWGKAIAGGSLYLLATGIPLAVAIRLVATPGNFATPFIPEMVQPGIADLIVGLAYYFAALVVALQGGGIVLRVLPLFAAVHLSFFALGENVFRVVVEAAVAMALALCIAGWGAIHGRESPRSRPWIGRVAFLLVAFYGACGVGDLANVLGGIVGRHGDTKFFNWDVLDDGAPARIDYVNSVIVSATDANGRPFTDPNYQPDRVNRHTLGMNTTSSYIGDSHGWRWRSYPDNYRESRDYLYAISPYMYPRVEQWFHLKKARRLVGFFPPAKQAFATLGADGFGRANSLAPGLPEDVDVNEIRSDLLSLQSPQAVRYASLAKREITTLVLPAPGPVYGCSHAWAESDHGSIDFLGVALGTGMAIYDARGDLVTMLPYHHDMDRWGSLSMGVVGAGMHRFVLRYDPSEWIDWRTRSTMPSYVETMDAKGHVLASATLAPLPSDVRPQQWNVYLARRIQSPVFFFGEMLYRRIGAAFGVTRLREALDAQFGRDLARTQEVALVLSLVALALAAVTFVWAQRSQLPRRRVGAWSLFVLALGLPGLIVFWLAGERPRRVACVACDRPRRIDETQCAHCRAEWPAPAATDTEIFDPAPAPGMAAST